MNTCAHSKNDTLDYLRFDFHKDGHFTAPVASRICRACGTHWYGEIDAAVFEIPRAIWDGWINSAMEIAA